MATQDSIAQKSQEYTRKTVNVVDLINLAKLEEKKEKRTTLVIAAVAISFLAVSGLIISL